MDSESLAKIRSAMTLVIGVVVVVMILLAAAEGIGDGRGDPIFPTVGPLVDLPTPESLPTLGYGLPEIEPTSSWVEYSQLIGTTLEPGVEYSIYPAVRMRESFGLGGQVSTFQYIDKMKFAGMTWIKFQVHEGDVDAIDKLQRAKASGFRVLLGIVGDPARATDSEYHDRYAAYVAEIAASGADAIEIWNEPNLDRDWPTGQVSPQIYIQLLSKSYDAIKAANPETIVISAALASTSLAKSVRSEKYWTETDYASAFVASGGLRYADCVGAHYNVGTAPPDASDPNAIWDASFVHFPRLLDYYKALTNSTRPLCFTEVGYLTAEGLAPLEQVAPNFAWASGNTLQEQADWLAQAVTIARADPQVELLIVWNVDFQNQEKDPHAGYAIIRSGGACPACDTLHRAMSTTEP